MNVFIVEHSYEQDDDCECEETKLIGAYSSQKEAEATVKRLKLQPGFDRLPDCFSISKYILNQDHWQEVFYTETWLE